MKQAANRPAAAPSPAGENMKMKPSSLRRDLTRRKLVFGQRILAIAGKAVDNRPPNPLRDCQ
jgi:hypothetical protein